MAVHAREHHLAALDLLDLDRAQEAAARGQGLSAGEVPLRLAPPEWLLMPAREAPAD